MGEIFIVEDGLARDNIYCVMKNQHIIRFNGIGRGLDDVGVQRKRWCLTLKYKALFRAFGNDETKSVIDNGVSSLWSSKTLTPRVFGSLLAKKKIA